MVVDSTNIVVIGALLGAVVGSAIGIFAGPVRDCFAHRTEIKNVRKAIYNELFISCQKLKATFDDFNRHIDNRDTDWLSSTDKMYYSGPTTFPVYDAFISQPISLYQLAEASVLAAAYFNMNAVNNAINDFNFSHTRFKDFESAKEELCDIYKKFLVAVCVVNIAFESNAHILNGIDKGALLKAWRKFVNARKSIKDRLSNGDCVEITYGKDPTHR
jgi:gas vesicle protein